MFRCQFFFRYAIHCTVHYEQRDYVKDECSGTGTADERAII